MALSPPLAVLGLVLAFAPVAHGAWRGARTDDRPGWPRIRRGLARTWGLALAVLLLVLIAGDPADLAIDAPSVGTLVDGTLYGFIAFGGTMLAVALLAKFRGGVSADPASLAVFEQPLHRRLAVAATGATVEALLFFGVAIEAILALGGGPYVAGAVSAAGLLAVRARFSVKNAVQWVPGAVVLSGIALISGTVVPVLLVRLLYDGLTLASGDESDYVTDGDA